MILKFILFRTEETLLEKVKFATIGLAKQEDDVKKRLKILVAGKDKAGEFYRKSFYSTFAYVSHRIPEISDDLYKIDRALKAGFGWELGPFEMWDILGVEKTLAKMKEYGFRVIFQELRPAVTVSNMSL